LRGYAFLPGGCSRRKRRHSTSACILKRLRRLTDEGKLKALNMNGKRVYTLEELDRYISSLPEWYDGAGERPEASNGERNGIQES
jgi:hypothetical protein